MGMKGGKSGDNSKLSELTLSAGFVWKRDNRKAVLTQEYFYGYLPMIKMRIKVGKTKVKAPVSRHGACRMKISRQDRSGQRYLIVRSEADGVDTSTFHEGAKSKGTVLPGDKNGLLA